MAEEYTICKSSGGRGVGSRFACGLEKKNCYILLLDNWSAIPLCTPAMCSILIEIS